MDEQTEKFLELLDASWAFRTTRNRGSIMNFCIYHKHCTDGFGAAWAVKQWFDLNMEDCQFHAGVYNKAPPDVQGMHVYLVDFSYSRAVIKDMLEVAASVTIIDHHKSAIADLETLKHPNLNLVFSQVHSGAVLTWKHFFPGRSVPQLLLHIEDRDLWKFILPGTREIIAALYSHEFDFAVWDALDLTAMYNEGPGILRAHDKLVKDILSYPCRYMCIGNKVVPVVNCGKSLASDVGNALSKGHDFSASYYDTDKDRIFSLRSATDGTDVSEIASKYGGGGHRNAAGFSIPLDKVEASQLDWN